jgi:predicted  nucleic acid-binding Zn-ribbon protein
MPQSWTQTLVLGRAAAEVLTEKANQAATELLSELGKLDAERRESMRSFIEEVNARAGIVSETSSSGTSTHSAAPDLQSTIDDLRAEIAETRNELQRYRNGQR